MKAEIIAVGSELLTPDRQDTNSLFLTAELNKLGIEVLRKTIVGDERALLLEAFRDALNRVPIIISCGGLGPTEDDLTRETVAELLGRKLVRSDAVVLAIEARFRSFGRQMTENNLRQAMVPEGAELLTNPRGTAPGLWLEKGDQVVVLLPGPPRELKPLFLEEVLPRLQRRAPAGRMFHREFRVTGLGESHVDHLAGPIYTRYPEVQTTVLASPGEVQIHLRMWSADAEHAGNTLAAIQQALDLALAERIFSRDGSPLEAVVAHQLLQHNATIAAAESCTGGLLAERLTTIPGSSAYFLGSVVCYSNELKTAWAGVPPELISTKGAVSSEVAVALAQGIRRKVGSTLGMGVTGIAGPGGGSEEKPVGTVHIALAGPTGVRERSVRFVGDRDMIRMQAAQAALDMVRLHFLYNGQAPPVRP
ncbi:MAG TPA: competence/damage-inducible protein A [Candidatus Eisenbacteria bacterium]|jgi:nicotinamide-nucleotide amidase|nr:competence/damage-inducible protein A [Candidatus Eisenbacteria bacterium]